MNFKFKHFGMGIVSVFFTLILVIATVAPASATFTKIDVVSWDVMNIGFDYGSHTGGLAGEITVKLYDDTLGWGDLQSAFCVNLDAGIGQDTYDIASMLLPAPVQIAWLMDTFSPASSTVAGASLQASIWKVLYANNFTLTGPSEVDDLYNVYMDALGNATIDANYLLSNYSIVNMDGVQNLLVQNSSSAPVPEPTTMLLFGVGLVGLAGIGRKKTR